LEFRQHESLRHHEFQPHHGLNHAHGDRCIARPFRDLLLSRSAFLAQFLQPRNRGLQQLENDRRRDVRHDAQPENGGLAERSAREDRAVLQNLAETVGVFRGLGRSLDQFRLIHAGERNPEPDAIDHQHAKRKQHAVAQLGNPEDIDDCLQHNGYREPKRLR
jgi:hypothetical protein